MKSLDRTVNRIAYAVSDNTMSRVSYIKFDNGVFEISYRKRTFGAIVRLSTEAIITESEADIIEWATGSINREFAAREGKK